MSSADDKDSVSSAAPEVKVTKKHRKKVGEALGELLDLIGSAETGLAIGAERIDEVSRWPALHIMQTDLLDDIVPFSASGVPLIDCGAKPTGQPVSAGVIANLASEAEAGDAVPHFLESRRYLDSDLKMFVTTVRTASLKEARGFKVYGPHLCKCRFAGIGNGKYLTGERLMSFNGSRWVNICLTPTTSANYIESFSQKHPVRGGQAVCDEHIDLRNDETLSQQVMATYGLHEWQRKIWTVEIGSRNGLRLIVPCDAVGVQLLLKDRDKEPGMKRRTPVIHWVNEHWRENPIDEELEHEVIAHLRGKDRWFSWAGWDCQISIPDRLRELAQENKDNKRRKSRRKSLRVIKQIRSTVMKVELAEVEVDGEFAGFQVLQDGKSVLETESIDAAMDELRRLLLQNVANRLIAGKQIPESLLRPLALVGAQSLAARK